ncbi:MAG: helical backbone metal receptor [Rubricoccaceae bacterium]|nr:helical backbone metal receptor [Rubricoccaceae bacterium]
MWLDTHDALGRPVTLDAPPRRIVSLVPSQTELLAALGLDAEVVGLTRFCVHPEGWKARKAIVGGTKNVSLDRVAALQPDLVIANREENEREPVEAIAAIAPVYVTDVATVDDALGMIRAVGRLVGRAERAAALADEIGAGFDALAAAEPLRAAYFIWRDPWMTVGSDTFISDVMQRAGLLNAFGDRTRYPEVTIEAVADRQPDVLLLSSEPYPFKAEHATALEESTSVPTVLVDGEVFSWYGSRMRLAPPYLQALHTRLQAIAHP